MNGRHQPSPQSDPFEDALFFIRIFYWGLTQLAKTLEVFLHSHFGASYLGYFGIFLKWFVFNGIFSVWVSKLEPGEVGFVWLFFLAFLVVGMCRQVAATKRQFTEERQHSRYNGFPWAYWYRFSIWQRFRMSQVDLTEVNIKCFAEPLFCFAVSLVAGIFSYFVGGYIFIAAQALLIKALMDRRVIVQQVRRAMDSQADSDILSNSLAQMGGATPLTGTSPTSFAGRATSPVQPPTDPTSQSPFDTLDPKYKDLISGSTENKEAERKTPEVVSSGSLDVRLDEQGRIVFPCKGGCGNMIMMEARYTGRGIQCQNCETKQVIPPPPDSRHET